MAPLGFDLFTVISGIAIIVVLFSLTRAIDYKKTIPDGVVGKSWNVIVSWVVFFFLVYLTIPLFFVLLSQEAKDIIVAFIFLFGAVFILINLMLVHRIIIFMKRQ
jgi:hypothetical protein